MLHCENTDYHWWRVFCVQLLPKRGATTPSSQTLEIFQKSMNVRPCHSRLSIEEYSKGSTLWKVLRIPKKENKRARDYGWRFFQVGSLFSKDFPLFQHETNFSMEKCNVFSWSFRCFSGYSLRSQGRSGASLSTLSRLSRTKRAQQRSIMRLGFYLC